MINFRPHKLQVKEHSGKPQRDKDGHFIDATSAWGTPMPCRYETDGKENIVTSPDGSFTRYTYVVWLDKTNFPFGGRFVRLIDENGQVIESERQVQKQVTMQLRTKLYL